MSPRKRKGVELIPGYNSWVQMKQRCFNTRSRWYPSYGGRGITVCDRWRDDFHAFISDMGPRPTPEHSIDRIDNDGNYEPGNCRWATQLEQRRNVRPHAYWRITFRGETRDLKGWASHLGLSVSALRTRIKRWGVERALTIPPDAPILTPVKHYAERKWKVSPEALAEIRASPRGVAGVTDALAEKYGISTIVVRRIRRAWLSAQQGLSSGAEQASGEVPSQRPEKVPHGRRPKTEDAIRDLFASAERNAEGDADDPGIDSRKPA